MSFIVIIMAGGLGKRMKSDIPKVLHHAKGMPMICHVIKSAQQINPDKILIVVGKYRPIIESTIKQYSDVSNIEYINQPEALGTGHAILCCRDSIMNYNSKVLILSGDTPFVSSKTMNNMLNSDKATIMTTQYEENAEIFQDYGRIIENNGYLEKIVEKKDCNSDQLAIHKVNCGIYAFDSKLLCKYLPYIDNKNAQNEYYLTDIIEIIKTNENINIGMYDLPVSQQHEIFGINTKEQLELLNMKLETLC